MYKKMVQAADRIFDPKKRHVSLAIVWSLLWLAISWAWAFARVYDRVEDLEWVQHLSSVEVVNMLEKVIEKKLDANNDKLILRLDDRYEKKK